MKRELLFQLDIAWQLFEYHCHNLSEEEAMWCKTSDGLQIRKKDGCWIADWPDTEDYTIGPSSIAWTMWHIIYWWKNTLSSSKENIILETEFIESLSEEDLLSDEMYRWPFTGRNMYSLILWLNVEFMKNVAEIGSGRFLYATSIE